MGNNNSCPPAPVAAHSDRKIEQTTTHLLSLDERVLCKIFQFLTVRDKRQNVQRTCMHFRAVLQQPSCPGTWGCFTVRMSQNTDASPQSMIRLINWLLDRKAGISKVKLYIDLEGIGKPYDPSRAAREQSTLHALAAAMAAEDVALDYAGYQGGKPVVSAPISFASMDDEAVAALQQCVYLLGICCSDFQATQWKTLCSLGGIGSLGVSLKAADPPALHAPVKLQSVQLTSLRYLLFIDCNVSLEPVLQHLSALTRLTSLRFERCSDGLNALSAGMPPLCHLMDLALSDCNFVWVPSLANLTRLEELNLDKNADLHDGQMGLHGVTSVTKLSMRGSTPLGKGTLDALKELPLLQEFDVRDHVWTPKNAALLGRMQHWSHAMQVELIV